MSPLIIVLGVVIVIILYYLVKYYYSTKSLLTSIYLRNSNADIPNSSIAKPNSLFYSFGTWVYVNNLVQETYLFTYLDNPQNQYFSIFVGDNNKKPSLRVNIKGYNGVNIVYITDNFPIQKWVHVCVSVNSDYSDSYLDGKLVKSTKLTYPVTIAPTTSPRISFGYGDIYLSKLTRWETAIDPKAVYDEYTAGNGLNNSTFDVALSLTKDSKTTDYTLYSNG